MRLAEIFESVIGRDAPLEFRAFDGSRAGDPEAPVRIEVRSPLAMSYLASAPGELGLARAYVSGTLDIDGDMYTALASMSAVKDTSRSGISIFGRATNVPRPGTRRSRPSETSCSTACRTVILDRPYSWPSSRSDGIGASTGSSAASMRATSRSRSCRYFGTGLVGSIAPTDHLWRLGVGRGMVRTGLVRTRPQLSPPCQRRP